MPTEEEVIAVLRQKNVIPLIIYLHHHRNERIIQLDLRAVSKSIIALDRTAQDLERIGVMTRSVSYAPNKRITYALTQKGMRVAESIMELRELFQRSSITDHLLWQHDGPQNGMGRGLRK